MEFLAVDASTSDAWRELCRRTNCLAMFVEHVRIRPLVDGGAEVSRGWYPLVGAFLLFLLTAAFGCAACVAAVFVPKAWFFLPSAIIAGIISLGLAHSLIQLLRNQPRLKWRDGRAPLSIRFGNYPRFQSLELKRDELEAHLDAPNVALKEPDRKGIEHSIVLLKWSGSDDPAKVFQGPHHRALRLYAELARFLGNDRAMDDTLAVVQLSGGETISVSRAPISTESSSGVTAVLKYPAPDRAMLLPSAGVRGIGALMFALGVALSIGSLPSSLRGAAAWLIVVLWSVAPLFTILGLCMMLFGLGPARVSLNRRVGSIDIRWYRSRREVAYENVTAIQIASKFIRHSDGTYTVYEVNLVLRDPAGDRVNLLAHGVEKRVRADALALAEFLGKPLLDHS